MAEVEKMTVEKAAEFLGQGFHCSQCVIGYGADKLGLDKDLMLQVSGGLGGGSGAPGKTELNVQHQI